MTSNLESEPRVAAEDVSGRSDHTSDHAIHLNGGPVSHRVNEILAAVGSLIEEAEAIDTRGFEEADLPTIERELKPSIESVLSKTESRLGEVFEHYEASGTAGADTPRTSGPPAEAPFVDPETSFEGCIESLVSGSGVRRVADLAFVARLELRRQRRKLGGVDADDDPWEHIAVYAGVRRNILKSTAALETAICEYEGIADRHRWYADSVRRALRIRHAYASFRDSLHLDQSPTHTDVHRRIRGAGIAIARLIGRDGYEDYKIRDRRMLRDLQRRMLKWLRGYSKDEPSEFHIRSGIRLWQDVVGLANLLMQVSNRPELCDHDAAAIGDLFEVLFGGFAPATRITPAQLDRLRTLRGLDSELDECVQLGEDCPMETWRQVLSRVRDHLRQKRSP